MNVDPRLRLRHLSAFLAIARTGSVGQAASELSVTQPAVSKTLRELEDILGGPLFDRTGRRVVLNAAGTEFQRLAGSAMSALAQAQDSVRARAARRRRLRVGVLPTAATRLMPDAALRFRTAHPHCTLRVSTGPNWLLLSQLREGALDLVVGRMADPQRMEGLTFRQLYAEGIVGAVRAGHPVTGVADTDTLRRYPLILPPAGAAIHQTVRAWLVSIGAGDVIPAFETVSAAFGQRALVRSDAVWFISRGVITDGLDRGDLRALDLASPLIAGPVGVSLRAGHAPSEDMLGLVEALETEASRAPRDA
ncbi:LysR substrate-binding domain-containing protein (plasmid) [Roseivivax marinus]|uniref:LysR substrate-binding domain-containing protein n=1 Tax=Roseivivax marinus TaxID=1379903 RepID=UPI001F03F50A|nr:LysR substrate-binding domain-containing protein [Roseivivax marinus]UMA66841.1 LysR substrate-binding domain-containing protein [Roseivivax marinus]